MFWQRRMRAAWQRCRGVNKKRGRRRRKDEAQMSEESTQKRRYKKDSSRFGHRDSNGSNYEEWYWTEGIKRDHPVQLEPRVSISKYCLSSPARQCISSQVPLLLSGTGGKICIILNNHISSFSTCFISYIGRKLPLIWHIVRKKRLQSQVLTKNVKKG